MCSCVHKDVTKSKAKADSSIVRESAPLFAGTLWDTINGVILRKPLPLSKTEDERKQVVSTLRDELEGKVDARLEWASMSQRDRVARYGMQRAQGPDALREVAMALQSLHNKGVIHCDVKAKNVLAALVQGSCVRNHKLCDFGRSYVLAQGQTCALVPKNSITRGSSTHTAPEVFPEGEGPGSVGERRLSCAADSFSFGTLTYDVLVSKGEKMSVRAQLMNHFGDSECASFVCVFHIFPRACGKHGLTMIYSVEASRSAEPVLARPDNETRCLQNRN